MTSTHGALAITTLGMVTSLGGDAFTSCAAARAGLTRSSELKVLDFHGEELFGRETLDGPPTVFGHTVRDVADGFSGVARALLLGRAAIHDLLEQRRLSARERSRTGLVLNLSDDFVIDADAGARGVSPPSVGWRQRTGRLHIRLAESHSLPVTQAHLALRYGGNAGIASAVQDAVTMIDKGPIDRCIVGAIDSRAEARFLPAAARLKLLRTSDNPVGLIPGEAAAFFVLERASEVAGAGSVPIATIAAATVARDPTDLLSNDRPPTGTGLAEALRKALGSAKKIGFSVGDMNGTQPRAVEWANTLFRLRSEHQVDIPESWFPALSFGDTGAAAGAVGVCVAIRAFARGYARGNSALVWLSSEGEAKGALLLAART